MRFKSKEQLTRWHKRLKQLKQQQQLLPAPSVAAVAAPQEVNFTTYCALQQIKPLTNDTVVLTSPLAPRFSVAPNAATDNQWQMFDEAEAAAEFFRFGQCHLPKELRAGKFNINATLDLHNYTKSEALERLAQFIHNQHGCLKIIHGQGLNSEHNKPVLQSAIRKYLSYQPQVVGYSYGAPQQGGNGVTLVKLRIST